MTTFQFTLKKLTDNTDKYLKMNVSFQIIFKSFFQHLYDEAFNVISYLTSNTIKT